MCYEYNALRKTASCRWQEGRPLRRVQESGSAAAADNYLRT